MTMAYHRFHGMDTRIVRIFNTYGPRMRPNDGRVVSNFIVQARSNEPLTIYGDGSQTRSFCYVSDEVEGIYRLFMRGDSNPTNIGNPNEFTVRQLAELVIELTGTKATIVQRELPVDDPKVRRPDITRAREMLGWEPTVALREGVGRTIDYFRSVLTKEAVSARALEIGALNYKSVASILANNLDRVAARSSRKEPTLFDHPNVRGPRYFN
jgi:dTDP-glucose 4,6-dehydratase